MKTSDYLKIPRDNSTASTRNTTAKYGLMSSSADRKALKLTKELEEAKAKIARLQKELTRKEDPPKETIKVQKSIPFLNIPEKANDSAKFPKLQEIKQ